MSENEVGRYWPRSELVVKETYVPRAKYPAIDAHNHLTNDCCTAWERPFEEYIEAMDAANVEAVVNLSGGWDDTLKHNIERLEGAYPGRFHTFCTLDWNGMGAPGWLETTLARLETAKSAGALGLKVYKELGLGWRDVDNKLFMASDSRISEVWQACGELGLPVLIHSADPRAFFRPITPENERWDELHKKPEWAFTPGGKPPRDFPEFEALIEALYSTIEAHPRTTFITAHVGCYPENLAFVSQMLDKLPNMYTDISARMAELGRAPYSARRFFLKHTDRILFGTDNSPKTEVYRLHWRFLETDDEYFSYSPREGIPPQGRWRVYGLYLPDDVLKKIYRDNWLRVVGKTD